jgi:large-conductance mechanosensitive channel
MVNFPGIMMTSKKEEAAAPTKDQALLMKIRDLLKE